ncbi:MAG: UDP-N-acetylglucosamine 1-carboxyvinyltransferase [Proteobacteria bacterium]|nr:UDP-N-acetylglucosamine 1-carboxyvinyltransferase [Cystobacterineae bacterium]MCL2258843.1 UDP-N-acetylglucosamine 1-carboxyvinyltransferase [Cystobacterineae bacterium]MCL2314775.1 UDP-N-acetylglucosamine 1-carboxyvinyltransferase [Pseudomonadota bacterium]
MDSLSVCGNGPLKGQTFASGSKNAALPLLASALLAEGTHHFENVPRLADIRTMLKLLRHIGLETSMEHNAHPSSCTLHNPGKANPEAPYELVKTMRASVLVLGPLLAKYGKAKVSLPGGCAIGARPIDLHLKALSAMGAHISLSGGYVEATAQRLHGADFRFDTISVTGTENLLMAASLAKGTTRIRNAAQEPEVAELVDVLKKMGAQIEWEKPNELVVEGVEALTPCQHTVCADRIEAGTLLVAAAITGGDVFVQNAQAAHLGAVIEKLREAGCEISQEHKNGPGLRLVAPPHIRPLQLQTQEYPGFPTDMQAQFMALLSIADGDSEIAENIFENRYMHVAELCRMGAHIHVSGTHALIHGVSKLSGAPVMATDLRASASLVLAALRAEGTTTISRVYHLDRGYEQLEEKLSHLGAKVERLHG